MTSRRGERRRAVHARRAKADGKADARATATTVMRYEVMHAAITRRRITCTSNIAARVLAAVFVAEGDATGNDDAFATVGVGGKHGSHCNAVKCSGIVVSTEAMTKRSSHAHAVSIDQGSERRNVARRRLWLERL